MDALPDELEQKVLFFLLKVGDLQAVMAAHAISKMWQAQVLVVSRAN